jgi:hypothetical protein
MITLFRLALGSIVIGGMFAVVGVRVLLLRGRVAALCLAGRASTGRVVGIDRNKAGRARLRLAFLTADGREVEFREPIAVRAKVGDQLRVRYRAGEPRIATSCRPRQLVGEVLAFGIVFVLGGAAAVTGALVSLARGSKDVVYGVSGSGFMAIVAATSWYLCAQSYATARSWRRRVVADGVVERVEPREGDGGYARPWIAYDTRDGRRVEYQDVALSGCVPGEKVSVYYDPDHPEFTSTSVDRSGNIEQTVLFGALGLLAFVSVVWWNLIR